MQSHEEDAFALAFARIECHYFVNGGFFEVEDQFCAMWQGFAHPATIVHGRYDVVCPVANAWDLHRAWPEADLRIIADAGHSGFEAGITDALINATDRYAA